MHVVTLTGPELTRIVGLPGLEQLAPSDQLVAVVVEDGDQVLGYWCLGLVPHAEPLWIRPEAHGNPRVALGLFRGMAQLLEEHGIPGAMAIVTEPAVAEMAAAAGFKKVPGDLWILFRKD